ncbi:hypothetical protein [Streptomyces sp. 35G-GA-8]|uniref:hypothetical protein n=1 Tax=Streptomyces sp. 35G-GA-8 TaxID=2939434 RepID=UPI00201E992F|nr:hypothetical protein [Streptomyces sp. 35G-GA-8]MCL7376989.1 hypothetical protein [Streptomyces sp. 35G-GA-8]
MTGGLIISFLGMDGVGKSTIARALHHRLRADGHRVRLLSRRDYLLSQPEGATGDAHRALYDASLRSLYSFATTTDGACLGEVFPGPAGDLRNEVLEKTLNTAAIGTNDPRTLTAAALCEIAGALAYRVSIVEPELARGTVVLEETDPFKMIAKLCLFAQHSLQEEDPAHQAAVAVLRSATTVLRPAAGHVPVLVRCDPHRAYERRMKQRGALGALEHYGPVGGGTGRAAYIDLQARSQDAFDALADDWGCVVVPASTGKQSAVASAVGAILADARIAR